MIRTIITPETNHVNLSIPKEYLGKKVEILLFSIDESKEEQPERKKSIASLRGTLNSNDAKKLLKHVKKIRNEWERNF